MNIRSRAPVYLRDAAYVAAGLSLASWGWKTLEWIGRERDILRRNLGWGFVVDLTIPLCLTIAAGVIFAVSAAVSRARSD